MSVRRKRRSRRTIGWGVFEGGIAGTGRRAFSDRPRTSIGIGHFKGGHGALTFAKRHPDRYRATSAFFVDSFALACPWGIKALGGYLGGGKQAWRKHDAMALIEDGARSCWWWATPIRSHRAAASGIDASRLRESQHPARAAPPAGRGLPVPCAADRWRASAGRTHRDAVYRLHPAGWCPPVRSRTPRLSTDRREQVLRSSAPTLQRPNAFA